MHSRPVMARSRSVHSKTQPWNLACGAILLAGSLAGCGGGEPELPRAAVEGSVSLNGQPLKSGVIRFVPTDGTTGPKTSVTITSGRFVAEEEHGPIVGNHRIEIESTDNGGLAPDDEEAFQRVRASGVPPIPVVVVPEVYNDRSTMTETVTADGPNQYQFTLSSTGGI